MPEEKQQLNEKQQKFYDEYKALSKKHGYDFQPVIIAGERGIIPTVKLVSIVTEKQDETKNND